VGAVAALHGIQSSVENLRIQLENRRNILVSKLQAFDGVKVAVPDGTFYAFVDFRAYEKDVVEGVERIKWALDPNSPNELYLGNRKLLKYLKRI
jgi:aspartate aminotransferase